MNQKLLNILQIFELPGKAIAIHPLTNGHINDTWKVTVKNKASDHSFVLQKINTKVFKEPWKIMENIHRVLSHLKNKNVFKKNLEIIPTVNKKLYYEDNTGDCWRIYNFIEGSTSFDLVPSAEHAFQGAKGFGLFIKNLDDLPEPPLHEILKDFHNTEKRYHSFISSISKAQKERLKKASELIKKAKEFSYLKSKILTLLASGEIPYRVTHNDTKLNNALLDNETLEAVALIDLDTLMPGSALYDFGDYVRTAARIGAEDEENLAKVSFSPEFFDASLKGFLASTADTLNDQEIENLPISAAVITFEIGLRFLTDYLEGDIFYKTNRPGQNLHRAAVQFKILEEMIAHFS